MEQVIVTSNKRQATVTEEQANRFTAAESSKAFRRLIVWQKADELAFQVYQVTTRFPSEERFGLVSQMRRASVSVAANIVEGYTYVLGGNRRRFYGIARGSLTELEYYITESEFETLSALRQEVGRLLHGLLSGT